MENAEWLTIGHGLELNIIEAMWDPVDREQNKRLSTSK